MDRFSPKKALAMTRSRNAADHYRVTTTGIVLLSSVVVMRNR